MAGYGRRKGNGAGQGDGWGGPAKGVGSSKNQSKHFTSDDGGNATVAAARANGMSKRAIREQRSEALEDIIFDLANKAEREETRITAARSLHAIYNGTPIARNINVNSDDVSALSDDELIAELARTGGTETADHAGTEATGMSPKLPGVLH